MASEAIAGVGTKFQRWSGSAWVDLAEITDIEGPDMTKEVLEVTSIDTVDGYAEFITGFAEGGSVNLSMNFTRDTYELMKADFEVDLVRYYKIILPDAEATYLQFAGLVTELPITMEAGEVITADVTIQVSGQVTMDVGSSGDIPPEESVVIPESSDAPVVESSDSSGSGAGWVGPGKYASVAITGFQQTDAEGFIEFRFYHNGVSAHSNRIFYTCATNFDTREVGVYVYLNHVYLYVRNAVLAIHNLIYTTAALAEGWHTVRITSTNGPASSDGGEYIITIDGSVQALTVSNGINDGRWLNKVASNYRANVSIGAEINTGVVQSMGGWIDYVNYNDEHIWYLGQNTGTLSDSVGSVHLTWS